jgi:mitochondrial fission protein ELM1
MPPTLVLTENLAGLQAQGLGLAEAAGLETELRTIEAGRPWRWIPARAWPDPLRTGGLAALAADPADRLVISCGGTGGVLGAALRRPGRPVVQIQHPRIDPRRFDLVIVQRHDGLTGPNVLVTRTALHRAGPLKVAQEAARWRQRLAHLPRPLVSVLVGGANGRYRFDDATAASLGASLADMARRDGVGIALTPSRRTGASARRILASSLAPVGGWVWDMTGDNPYFALLGLADVIVATADSVSMASEAAATRAPLLLATLPGRSRRIGQFMADLVEADRARPFRGRAETWQVDPMNDTQEAADAMCRRLQL